MARQTYRQRRQAGRHIGTPAKTLHLRGRFCPTLHSVDIFQDMRVLHVADVHLDTPFPGRTEAVRQRLQEASREALHRCFEIARRERVDAVVIAGDLFDGSRLSFGTERFLLEEMRALDQAGILVVYATGNHDSVGERGRPTELEWPPNVTLAAGLPPVRVAVRDPEGTVRGHITAVGHATARETRDLSVEFPDAGTDGPEMAVLHSQVESARSGERHGKYAPSNLDHLRSLGYDYWALGHVHQRQVLSERPWICYSGNPQGRTFNETGVKGCILVDFRADNGAQIAFHDTSVVRFEVLKARGLEEHATLDRLLTHVEALWATERTADPYRGDVEWIVRVELEGPTPLSGMLRHHEERDTLADELAARIGALWVDVWTHGTHPAVSIEQHAGRQDSLGEALRLLGGIKAGRIPLSEIAPAELAGHDAEGSESREVYLKSLLDGASGELITRMLADKEGDGT